MRVAYTLKRGGMFKPDYFELVAVDKGLVTVTFQAFGAERQTTVKRAMVDAAREAA